MDYKRVLVLHYTNGMSGREIAEATGDGKTTVNEFLKRFRECEELSYPLSEEVTNEFIAERLYRKAGKPAAAEMYRDFDPEEVCRTLTKKGRNAQTPVEEIPCRRHSGRQTPSELSSILPTLPELARQQECHVPYPTLPGYQPGA